jgi:mono/diheme cytochrome c family protein
MLNKKVAMTIGILGLTSLFLAAGCGSSSAPAQPKQDAASAPTSQASAQPAATQSGSSIVAGDPNKGKEIFNQSCTGCHSIGSDQIVGPGLKGEAVKPKMANGNPMSDDNLKAWIKAGGTGKIGNMPGMATTLNDQQITDVVAYLKTLK